MRETIALALAGLCFTIPGSVAWAANFPYSGQVAILMEDQAVANGTLDRTKVFVMGAPIGFSARQFSMGADIYAGSTKIVSVSCTPGDIVDMDTVASAGAGKQRTRHCRPEEEVGYAKNPPPGSGTIGQVGRTHAMSGRYRTAGRSFTGRFRAIGPRPRSWCLPACPRAR